MRTIDEYIKEKYREKIVDTTDMDKQTGILLPNQILVKTQNKEFCQCNPIDFLVNTAEKGFPFFLNGKLYLHLIPKVY